MKSFDCDHCGALSAYASVHPWEDWAETWALYLHMVDSLETAAAFGISLHPHHPAQKTITVDTRKMRETGASFDAMLECWLPLTCALNSLNRGGIPDLYPFVLPILALGKMRFVHDIVVSQQHGIKPSDVNPHGEWRKAS